MYDWQKRKLKRELGDLYDIFSDYECEYIIKVAKFTL